MDSLDICTNDRASVAKHERASAPSLGMLRHRPKCDAIRFPVSACCPAAFHPYPEHVQSAGRATAAQGIQGEVIVCILSKTEWRHETITRRKTKYLSLRKEGTCVKASKYPFGIRERNEHQANSAAWKQTDRLKSST